MSFDLYFCGPPGTQLDFPRVKLQMGLLEHTTESRSDDGALIQFEYRNPETGVYCLFDLHMTLADEQEESLVLPDPYVSAGLSVSINFLRPHFFAVELMPLISLLARSLEVSLYDPQEDRIYPPNTSSDTLTKTWIEHNRRVTDGMAHADRPITKPYLTLEQSLYWWRYTNARKSLQSRLGEHVFVPSIFLMTDDQLRVQPVVLCSASNQPRVFRTRRVPLPQLFPQCECIMLAWGKTANELTKGIVQYSVAMSAMAGILEDVDGPVPGLKVLRPSQQERAAAIFDGLPITDLAGLRRIASDDFVDVKPS